MGGLSKVHNERGDETALSNNGKVSGLVTRNTESPVQGQTNSGLFNTKSVIQTLEGLMKQVTAEDCTPDTVNAACNCADKITQLLRVHIEYEKISRRF